MTATTVRTNECSGCLSNDLEVVFGHDCENDGRNGHNARLAGYGPMQDRTPTFGQGNGSGSGFGRPSNPASEKQVDLLVKLGMSRTHAESLTKSKASEHIDRLLGEQKNQAPAAPAPTTQRPNRYGSKCVNCGTYVEAEAGWLCKDVNGRWASTHKNGECVTEAPAKAAAPTELEDGIYKRDDEIVKVYVTQSGQKASKTWDTDTESFEYTGKRGLRGLTAEHRMTLDEAKAFGAIYGICCNCSRTLRDDVSIEAGIGPICARRFA